MLDCLICVGTLLMLAGVLLPRFYRPRVPAQRISCVNHLKQIGLAVRLFANDHEDRFPWEVSVRDAGALISSNQPPSNWAIFRAISNELSTPKILTCPSDNDRVRASHFGSDPKDSFSFQSNTNVSYFLHLSANEAAPNSILGGDRNLRGGTRTVRGAAENQIFTRKDRTRLVKDSSIGFDKTIHKEAGNVALADGSVQQLTSATFRQALDNSLDATRHDALALQLPTDVAGTPTPPGSDKP